MMNKLEYFILYHHFEVEDNIIQKFFLQSDFVFSIVLIFTII